MKAICENVFTFAVKFVCKVRPRISANDRRSVTEMSRMTIAHTIHHSTRPSQANATNAAEVKILSASGSRKTPHLETVPNFRAIQPSYQSVSAAIMNTKTESSFRKILSLMNNRINSGVNNILRIVSWFGNVILPQFKCGAFGGQVIKVFGQNLTTQLNLSHLRNIFN